MFLLIAEQIDMNHRGNELEKASGAHQQPRY
jgi:hypothetical protein